MPRLFLALFLIALAASMPAAAAPARIDIPVSVDGGAVITVETAWPEGARARALVVVVPGTGGLSDPYLNAELRERVYDPDRRGGLTGKLLAAGYAVAYFSQRGYAPLRSCVEGDSPTQRAAALAARCPDPRVRAGVDFVTITADTGRVFAALARHPRTRGLAQIALAYSEGMHHVSAAVGQHAMRPIGIVAVGGPLASLARIVPYQLQYEYFANVASEGFARCPHRDLTAEELFRCAGKWHSPALLAKMSEFMGAPTLRRQLLPLRREATQAYFRAQAAFYASQSAQATIAGNFEGHTIPVAWNGRFQYQQMTAAVGSLDQLGDFDGRVVYLFGMRDHLVPLPAPGACPARPDGSARTTCRVQVIEDVGHGLEDERGFPPDAVLDALLRAVDEVAQARKKRAPIARRSF